MYVGEKKRVSQLSTILVPELLFRVTEILTVKQGTSRDTTRTT